MDWRDISTAPKDGTLLLLAYNLNSMDLQGYVPWAMTGVVMGWWEGDYDPGWRMCFMEDGNADSYGYSSPLFQHINPTHWMPLPEPPSTSPDAERIESMEGK